MDISFSNADSGSDDSVYAKTLDSSGEFDDTVFLSSDEMESQFVDYSENKENGKLLYFNWLTFKRIESNHVGNYVN